MRALAPGELRQQLQDDRIALVSRLEDAAAAAGRAERELLRSLASCERAELWREDGCRNGAEWVSQTLGVSRWKASRWIGAARALETLPHVSAALERGALSLDKAVELTRFATPDSEAKLISWARRVSAAGIRRRADLATAIPPREVEGAHASRYLRWWWEADGDRLGLEGMLPADQGALVSAALERLADEVPRSPADDELAQRVDVDADELTLDQRRADALALMASAQISGDQDPDRATVVLHAPMGALSHDDGNCELAGGPVLHPETARRLSCDGRLQVVLQGREGNALGIGHMSQQVPAWLRRLVFQRDDHRCVFPGCEARRFLRPHHIWHWARGGPTDLDNLITICSTHHWLVHEGRWSVSRSERGTVTWFRPSGRRFDPGPAPPESDEIGRRGPEPPTPRLLIEARHYSPLFALAGHL